MPTQLLVYGFGPGSDFAGQLLGALERLEGGGALRIADALLVSHDADTGELSAVSLGGKRLDAMVATLIDVRLDAGARRRATERALGSETIRDIAAALAPGNALAAVLVEHVWADGLEDAVTRIGGEQLIDDRVEAPGLAALTSELVGAARGLAASPGGR